MKNISIKGVCDCVDLDRNIKLTNGAIIIQKENNNVIGVYLVTSFRDNKNKYGNDNTSNYCSLINLDSGFLAFEERCSRSTTERRVLRHITRAGFTYPYDPNSHDQDDNFRNMRIQVYNNGDFKINLELGEEYIMGKKR